MLWAGFLERVGVLGVAELQFEHSCKRFGYVVGHIITI